MRSTKAFLAPGIGLLGVAMFAVPAMASDANGGFALHGVGAQTCQMMLQELQPAAPAAPITPAAVVPSAAPLAATPSAASPPAPADASPTVTASAAPASPSTDAAGGSTGSTTPAPTAAIASPGPAPAALGMRPILTSWMMGYLTASDRLVKDTFDQTPVMAPDALTTMIIGVCQRNPGARVESVANNVLNQLAVARVLHDSPVVEARAGDRVVLIRKATLAAMQTTLVKDKLLKTPADGIFGASTVVALQAFQKSQNLPETGLPDPSTVVRLLVEMQPKLVEMPSKVAAKPARTKK